MICPKCKEEFAPEVKDCSECNVPLVEELPLQEVELVAVLETLDMGELMVAKSLLESEGIRYITVGEGMQTYFGHGAGNLSYLLKPVRLMVSRDDAEDAKNLLSGHLQT